MSQVFILAQKNPGQFAQILINTITRSTVEKLEDGLVFIIVGINKIG